MTPEFELISDQLCWMGAFSLPVIYWLAHKFIKKAMYSNKSGKDNTQNTGYAQMNGNVESQFLTTEARNKRLDQIIKFDDKK